MLRQAIIVAGGTGTRMQSHELKQFLLLAGKPLLMHTLKLFETCELFLVLPKHHIPAWKELCKEFHFNLPHTTLAGGKERFFSVQNAVEQIAGEGFVAVHDGVRPFASQVLIARAFAAAEEHNAAIPVLPLKESVRLITGQGSEPFDRERLRLVQTPQVFNAALLKKAYNTAFDPSFTDDATVAERVGQKVYLFEGEERNIKITTPADMRLAEAFVS